MRLLILALFLLIPSAQQIVPRQEGDKPAWKGCEDMVPMPKSDDGSHYSVCTDAKDHKWEAVDRLMAHHCEEVVSADKRDDYQHFTCTETYELLIRRQKASSRASP